jgi:hypothetical protein
MRHQRVRRDEGQILAQWIEREQGLLETAELSAAACHHGWFELESLQLSSGTIVNALRASSFDI